MQILDFELELLETRQMLAGDVSVRVAGGDLIVNGDSNGNEIVIRSTATSGEFLVQGIGGTKVEGTNSVTVQGVDDDVRINLRGGDNIVLMTAYGSDFLCHNFSVNDVRIRTGNGNDIVEFDNTMVVGNARVSTRGGHDVVFIHSAIVSGTTNINTASGDDTTELTQSVFKKRVSVNLASGDEGFNSDTSNYNEDLKLRAVSGHAVLGFVVTTVDGDYTSTRNGTYHRVTSQFVVVGETRFRGNANGSASGVADPVLARISLDNHLSTQPGLLEADQVLFNHGC